MPGERDAPTPPAATPEDPPADRRTDRDRRSAERRQVAKPVAVERRSGKERRSGVDRRAARSMNQYELDDDTLEFIRAVNRHKEQSGRPFPTWSEVLRILKGLGYEKRV